MEKKADVVIATISYVRSPEEHDRIIDAHRALAEKAKENGWLLMTINRKSSPKGLQESLENELTELGVEIIYEERPGVGFQLCRAYLEGAKRAEKAVIYTEGDKLNISHFLWPLIAPILNGRADMTVPSRDRQSMRRFAWSRRWSERLTNLIQGFVMHDYGDWQFGPKAFLPHVLEVREDSIEEYVKKRTGWEVATWLTVHLKLNYWQRVMPVKVSVKPMYNEDTNFWQDLKFRFFVQFPQAMSAIWDATA